MHLRNPVESLAAAVYTSLADKEVLPDIEHEFRQHKQIDRPDITDLTVIHFPQTWGSTALGFGGMGGAAMTTAYTTVVICRKNAAVFFNGRHCYSVDDFPEKFMDDVNKRRMASLKEAQERYLIIEKMD